MRREGVGLDQDDTDWTDLVVPGHWRDHPEFADSDGPANMPWRQIAVVDKDGQYVGLVFDGNIESLPGDYIYLPERNRAVAVDMRRGYLSMRDRRSSWDAPVVDVRGRGVCSGRRDNGVTGAPAGSRRTAIESTPRGASRPCPRRRSGS